MLWGEKRTLSHVYFGGIFSHQVYFGKNKLWGSVLVFSILDFESAKSVPVWGEVAAVLLDLALQTVSKYAHRYTCTIKPAHQMIHRVRKHHFFHLSNASAH